jgi:hypothetical protein
LSGGHIVVEIAVIDGDKYGVASMYSAAVDVGPVSESQPMDYGKPYNVNYYGIVGFDGYRGGGIAPVDVGVGNGRSIAAYDECAGQGQIVTGDGYVFVGT